MARALSWSGRYESAALRSGQRVSALPRRLQRAALPPVPPLPPGEGWVRALARTLSLRRTRARARTRSPSSDEREIVHGHGHGHAYDRGESSVVWRECPHPVPEGAGANLKGKRKGNLKGERM